jgi:hypothetical protein
LIVALMGMDWGAKVLLNQNQRPDLALPRTNLIHLAGYDAAPTMISTRLKC